MGVVGRNYGVNGVPSNVYRQRSDGEIGPGTTSRTTEEGLREGRWAGSRNYDAYRIAEERERPSTVIRTSQLEPSPEMLVPVLGQKRVKGEQGSGQ